MSASLKLNDTEIFSELNQTVTAKNINVAANDLTTPSMCKAWVNFNGTLTMTVGSSYGPNVGNVNPITSAFNVSSIKDNGVGDYTLNFTNALYDNNYAFALSGAQDSANINNITPKVGGTPSTTQFRITSFNVESTPNSRDYEKVSVLIFR